MRGLGWRPVHLNTHGDRPAIDSRPMQLVSPTPTVVSHTLVVSVIKGPFSHSPHVSDSPGTPGIGAAVMPNDPQFGQTVSPSCSRAT